MMNADTSQSDAFRNQLATVFADRMRKNARYSMRAFARSLDMDPSSISKILSGKRRLGGRVMKAIGTRLGISVGDLGSSESDVSGRSLHLPSLQYATLRSDQLEVLRGWYNNAILELLKTENFDSNVHWLSRRLGVSAAMISEALNRLERLGMIKRVDGEIQLIGSRNQSILPRSETSSILKEYQSDLLDLSKNAIENYPITKRDHTSLTIAIDSKKLELAKSEIKRFRRRFDRLMSKKSESNDEVYQLTVGFFPLTHEVY